MDNFSNLSKWIGLNEGWYDTDRLSPALQLRSHTFDYNGGKTTCLICGLGSFILYINGQRVGNDVLSPAFTAYDKRVLFVKYDVEKYLRIGKNIVAVLLGDGFYNQSSQDTWRFYNASWRNTPRLRLEIFCNGESVLVSDASWKGSYDGAIVHNAIRTGEWYDARKEDGWREVDYDDSAWYDARIVRAPGGKMYEQLMPPIREHRRLKAVKTWRSKNGWVYDFGENIAGYVGIEMRGNAGETVTVRYAEKLKGEEIDQSNIDFYIFSGNFSQDRYTFSGKNKEFYKPSFAYHGFQYVEISGVEEQPDAEAVTAYHVYTDLKRIGDFKCSNDLLDWIYNAGIRTFLNNYHGFPEDCPHREKNGWTGDGWLTADFATFNFDMLESYKKWLWDICDTQRYSGQICSVAPSWGWGYNWGSGPSYDIVLFILPLTVYYETGNCEIIKNALPFVRHYLDYIKSFEDKDRTVFFGLCDWRPPDNIRDLKKIDNRYSDTCCYYKILTCAAQIEKICGNQYESIQISGWAEEIRQAIIKRYIKGDIVDNDGQGALALAIYFDIVKGTQKVAILKKLVSIVKKDEYGFRTGILGTKAILNALSQNGYTDIAYAMVNRSDYPSYGYWRSKGATTLWESWLGDASLNHPMFGDVLNFMVRNIAGLKNEGIAYDSILINPFFFDDDCSAFCKTETANGVVSIEWIKRKNLFNLIVKAPEKTKIKLQINDRIFVIKKIGGIKINLNTWELKYEN